MTIPLNVNFFYLQKQLLIITVSVISVKQSDAAIATETFSANNLLSKLLFVEALTVTAFFQTVNNVYCIVLLSLYDYQRSAFFFFLSVQNFGCASINSDCFLFY